MLHPQATYRIQFHPGFGFAQPAELAGYLAELGITHVYRSPYLQAAPGRQHGHVVTDPHRVNGEQGGTEAHAALRAAFGGNTLGKVHDAAPTRMPLSGAGTPR